MYKIRPILRNNPLADQTLRFAATELQRYLCYVSEDVFSIIPTNAYDPEETKAIYLGVDLCECLPEVEDPEFDDAICIRVANNAGFITGTNPRAVLIAVYRFLKEKGFVFLRPGKKGEIYPDTLDMQAVCVCEKASYRHRGICIEGTVYQKYLNDIIDWLPKAAMNSYFVQFELPRVFFDRWYQAETPYREKVHLTDEELRSILSMAEDEVEKRGLLYHAVGHGWTSLSFGINATSWDVWEEPAEEYRDIIALVGGKRGLYNGIPMNTNLCYSQQKARDSITDCIVNYCKEHPNIQYLHFWLSDGRNNNCECENCRKQRVADHYVKMLNELDEKLSKEQLDTKIVFLVYTALLWRPLSEKIKNHSRFTLMFAPIHRSYSASIHATDEGTVLPYVLNDHTFPVTVADNIAYLNEWHEVFDGDGFDFDYHFMWDHFKDFGQYKHAQVLYHDVRNLAGLKLNGLISCQLQRAFFPSCMSMNVMAQTLWNRDSDFDAMVNAALEAEFGPRYTAVLEYFKQLSEYGCPEAVRGEESLITEKCRKKLVTAIGIIDAFQRVVAEEIAKDTARTGAWEKLQFFGELYAALLEFYLAFAKGNGIGDKSRIEELALKNEMRFKEEFDAIYFLRTLGMQIHRELVKMLEESADSVFPDSGRHEPGGAELD